MPDFVNFLGVMAGVIGIPMFTIFFVPPVAKALARRIEGAGAADPGLAHEVDALRDEVDALRMLAPRLAELEERLDFAERLLTGQGEPARLPAGEGEQ